MLFAPGAVTRVLRWRAFGCRGCTPPASWNRWDRTTLWPAGVALGCCRRDLRQPPAEWAPGGWPVHPGRAGGGAGRGWLEASTGGWCAAGWLAPDGRGAGPCGARGLAALRRISRMPVAGGFTWQAPALCRTPRGQVPSRCPLRAVAWFRRRWDHRLHWSSVPAGEPGWGLCAASAGAGGAVAACSAVGRGPRGEVPAGRHDRCGGRPSPSGSD